MVSSSAGWLAQFFRIRQELKLSVCGLSENPRTFLNSLLSEEDRNILANIYIYREKLLNEIKVGDKGDQYLDGGTGFKSQVVFWKELEVELADVQSEIEQIDVTDADR